MASNATEGFLADRPFDPADGTIDVEASKSCAGCDSPAKLQCPHCNTWFCGRACHKKDWPLHRALCMPSKEKFAAANAPEGHVRAILFPAGSPDPTWVWLRLNDLGADIVKALGLEVPKRTKTKSRSVRLAELLAINDLNKQLAHRKIGHGIRQFLAPAARTDGNNINESVLRLADPGHIRVFFGSALFVGFRSTAGTIPQIYYEDATVRDLHMIADWYRTRVDNPCIAKPADFPVHKFDEPGSPAYLMPAVKINCDGDIDGLQKYCPVGKRVELAEGVEVLSKDPFNCREPCAIASMAELPWVVHKVIGCYDPILDKEHETRLLFNAVGQFFKPDSNPGANAEEAPSLFDNESCGSLVVSHKHGRVINTFHVKAFADFVKAAFEAGATLYKLQNPDADQFAVHMLDMQVWITKAHFECYWPGWAAGMEQSEGLPAGWIASVSPYNNEVAVKPRDTLPDMIKSLAEMVATKTHDDAESKASAETTPFPKLREDYTGITQTYPDSHVETNSPITPTPSDSHAEKLSASTPTPSDHDVEKPSGVTPTPSNGNVDNHVTDTQAPSDRHVEIHAVDTQVLPDDRADDRAVDTPALPDTEVDNHPGDTQASPSSHVESYLGDTQDSSDSRVELHSAATQASYDSHEDSHAVATQASSGNHDGNNAVATQALSESHDEYDAVVTRASSDSHDENHAVLTQVPSVSDVENYAVATQVSPPTNVDPKP